MSPSYRRLLCAISFTALTTASGAWAQVANPATATQPKPASSTSDGRPAPTDQHLPSWQAPGESVTVYGHVPLREEELIGAYQQPRWTARRRFGETRIYVIPEGDFEFEYWLVPKFGRRGEPDSVQQQYEVEIGLPHRFQLDLYAVADKEGSSGPLSLDGTKVEMRYGLADWGRLWGNPAVYLEWAANSNAPDHVEAKLLFGGEVRPRLHWGANLVFEHEMGGAQTNANELTLGLSHTLRDEKFSIGAETKVAFEDVKADRGDYEKQVLVGPSIQVRPLPQAHLDLVLLGGVTNESPRAKAIVIFGWEF